METLVGEDEGEFARADHPSRGVEAKPKAPKPYQTKATKLWTNEELHRITSVISSRAAQGSLVAKRDLALLLYMSTGLRREEVIGFRGRDVQVTEEGLIIGGG